jgi:hypothetical protein
MDDNVSRTFAESFFRAEFAWRGAGFAWKQIAQAGRAGAKTARNGADRLSLRQMGYRNYELPDGLPPF